MLLGQFSAASLKNLDALPVDELHGATCPARKANAEDADALQPDEAEAAAAEAPSRKAKGLFNKLNPN